MERLKNGNVLHSIFQSFYFDFVDFRLHLGIAQASLASPLGLHENSTFNLPKQCGTGTAVYPYFHCLSNMVAAFVEHHHLTLFGTSAQLFL